METKQQKTLKNTTGVQGIGLFSGKPVTLTFKPAPPDHGIVFIRTDIKNNSTPPQIDATIENVIPDTRRTTLQKTNVRVETCEHCLSALAGLNIDNVIIELDSSELPANDGSANFITQALSDAGLDTQNSPKFSLKITEPVTITDNNATITALPTHASGTQFIYNMEYSQNAVIPPQIYAFNSTTDNYAKQIAPARTFILETEAAQLQATGVGKHLTHKDLLVIGPNGPIGGNQYRFDNELVRHKLLDLIGDLALLGCPIDGQIIAHRSGHALNHKLVRKLRPLLRADKHSKLINKQGHIDVRAIQQILPHRYPMLLIDRILEIDHDQYAIGIKNVSVNEPFFSGHYPGTPIMPGVLIVEAMAQLSGILLSRKLEHTGKLAVLMSMDKVKLRRPVVPGDQLIIEANTIRARSRTGHTKCRAYVGKDLAAEAEIMFMLVDAEQ